MPAKHIARLNGRVVGRFHGPPVTHVAVIVLGNGRIQCRGWGLRVDAESALERARRLEHRLQYGAVHEAYVDRDSSEPLMRRIPRPACRREPGHHRRRERV